MEQCAYIGDSLRSVLCEILKEKNPRKIYLVTGENSYIASGAKKICDELLSGYSVTHFSISNTNPNFEDIQRGILSFCSSDPDLVLAIGGGSVIDTAKAINILAAYEGDELADYIRGEKKITKEGVPLIAVPTTAGSGSEATEFAVVYLNGQKYSLAHEYIKPTFAIIDAALTASMSPYQTAVTGLDALCQAIESMWSIRATEESLLYSREALLIILAKLPSATYSPTLEVRQNMSYAAHLSGKAINIAKTTASHAMSYPLTMHFGIPHGHAVALTLPKLLEFNEGVTTADATHPMGADFTKSIVAEICDMLGVHTVDEAVLKLESLISSLGINTQLNKFGVSNKDINWLVTEMSIERAANNPRKFNIEDARKILRTLI